MFCLVPTFIAFLKDIESPYEVCYVIHPSHPSQQLYLSRPSYLSHLFHPIPSIHFIFFSDIITVIK